MNTTIIGRLERLEKRCRRDPLIVLASLDVGEEIEIPLRECLEREDAHFIKVVRGSSLKDLDLLLSAIGDEAERQL